ncbi:hypothetical protein Fmac_001395 [Flemingia macrophylla]|uniref:HTH myb-type domain-containing protein n=1 Tax=Flemingia macrophylla TaxID=520843 RepID=A0ABD1NH00_9FABA
MIEFSNPIYSSLRIFATSGNKLAFPVYSWVDEGAFVPDSLGNPLLDSQGRSYRYTNFFSSRPTYGPEYYYLPQAPPPAPLRILIKPPIFGLRLRPPPSPIRLEDKFLHPTSDYFLAKHFPALLNSDPHHTPPEPPLSPRKLAITPVLPVYEEGVYSCTPYMDDFVFTPSEDYQLLPSDAITSLPPPKYKRRIYSREVIKQQPWTPPQGTCQHVQPVRTQPTNSPSPPRRKRKTPIRSSLVYTPSSPPPFPKVEFLEPFRQFSSIPFPLYRTPSLLDQAIFGHLKMCTETPIQLYIPPSLFLPADATLLIAPDRIHPCLPPIDNNKLKDSKLPAQSMPKPTRKSYRLRWFNQIDPRINRRSFSEEEKDRLLAAHKTYGNKWAMIH